MKSALRRLTVASWMAFALAACGQSEFQGIAEKAVSGGGLPGVALYVRSGQDEWVGAAGLADLAAGTKLAPDDRFLLAGTSALVVATAAMQLVQSAHLALETPILNAANALDIGGLAPIAHATLQHTLEHATGLPEPLAQSVYVEHLVGIGALTGVSHNPHALLKYFAELQAPVAFPVGQGAQYSSANAALLGLAVENASGRPLARVLADTVFGPAAMADAGLAGFDERPRVSGYWIAPKEARLGMAAELPEVKPGVIDLGKLNPTWAWAAHGVIGTASDLGRFLDSLRSGRLLDRFGTAAMNTYTHRAAAPLGGTAEYGLGLLRRKVGDHEAVGFEGQALGFQSLAYHFPALNLTIAAVANGTGSKANLLDVLSEVHKLVTTTAATKLFD